jgi:flagella basal body P-ring formation protein FlgA
MTPFLPLLLAAGVAPAAPPVPWDCHALDSESVLARDLAPWVPGFDRLPPDFLAGYIESSGAPRVFHGADLENISKNRGVELHGLADVCLERRTFVVPSALIEAAMRKTLGEVAGLKIEILSSAQQAVPTGEVVFPRSGVQLPVAPEVTWRGMVRSGKGATYPVWARARITATQNRVTAATDLRAGAIIEPNQLLVEASEESPFEDTLVRRAEEAVGLAAKGTIPKGYVIRKSQVAPQMDVARGDVVRVEVYAGNAHLSMEARAETSGMKGATITVRNLSSGRDFQALVSGKGHVTVGGLTE